MLYLNTPKSFILWRLFLLFFKFLSSRQQVQRRWRQDVRRWISRFVREDERDRPARTIRQRRRISREQWCGQQSSLQQWFERGGRHSVFGVHCWSADISHSLTAAVCTAGRLAAIRDSGPAVRDSDPAIRGSRAAVRGPGAVRVADPRRYVPEQYSAIAVGRTTATRVIIVAVRRTIARIVVDRTFTVRTIRSAHAAETLRRQTERNG